MRLLGSAAYAACVVLHGSGTLRLYRRRFPLKGNLVLIYHEVSAAAFERHVMYLREFYHIVSLDDIVDGMLRGQGMQRDAVAITFDDGYHSLYTDAWPVMRKHGVPATAYLVTDSIGKRDEFWFDTAKELRKRCRGHRDIEVPGNYQLGTLETEERDRLLARLSATLGYRPASRRVVSWPEVREMAASGLLAVGSHTISHPYLTGISDERAEWEIVQSRALLEAELGTSARHFCYPDGHFCGSHRDMVRRAGYDSSVSTVAGINTPSGDILALKRVGVGPLNSVPVLAAKACGLWNSVYSRTPLVKP